jgi:hypothetical protein
MVEYLYLLIGHLVGDGLFSWQLKDAKRYSLFFLGVHSCIYAVTLMIAIYFFMRIYFTFYSFFIFLISHFIIDYWKCYIVKTDGAVNSKNLFYTFVDQILHLIILVLVVGSSFFGT